MDAWVTAKCLRRAPIHVTASSLSIFYNYGKWSSTNTKRRKLSRVFAVLGLLFIHIFHAERTFSGCIKQRIIMENQRKSSLNSRYYAEACNEWQSISLRLNVWATQKCRSGREPLAAVFYLTDPVFEPRTSRADNDVFYHYAN